MVLSPTPIVVTGSCPQLYLNIQVCKCIGTDFDVLNSKHYDVIVPYL